jgi:hypothetical protein
MKKNLLLSLAITLLFSINAWAQGTTSLTLTVGDKTDPMSLEDVAGPIEIPVFLEFDDPSVNVGAFEFIIDFDSSVLSFDGLLPGAGLAAIANLSSNIPSAGNLRVAWSGSPEINNGTLTDDDILVTLEFTALVGDSQLDFIDPNVTPGGSAFFADTASTTLISTTFNDGFITIASAVPLSMWGFFLMAGLIIAFLVFRAVRLF